MSHLLGALRCKVGRAGKLLEALGMEGAGVVRKMILIRPLMPDGN